MPPCFPEHSEFYQIRRRKNAFISAHVNIKNRSHPEVFVASNLTRKELLKQDKFTVEAGHTVDYLSTHRKEVVRFGGIALALIVLVAAVFYYRSSQLSVREQVLGEAIALSSAPVGTAPAGGGPSFPSQTAKDDAVTKAFTKLGLDYSGTVEAYVGEYYLAAKALDAGKVDDARKNYREVADHANANYASLAKLAIAQLDFAENRLPESETLLKDLMDHPTDLVSKTQATFTYAKVISQTKPDEARKLFLQIASERSDVSQIALTAMNELPQK
jgi:predicted negative regulator of RcsB-dependent stress response